MDEKQQSEQAQQILAELKGAVTVKYGAIEANEYIDCWYAIYRDKDGRYFNSPLGATFEVALKNARSETARNARGQRW